MYRNDLALNDLQWLKCHETQPNQIIYLIYMYEKDLVLNDLQWLICHKNQPNQIIYLIYMYKKDLALNDLQWLICHNTKLNKTKRVLIGPYHSGSSQKHYCAKHESTIDFTTR